jgi:hypothetical protein
MESQVKLGVRKPCRPIEESNDPDAIGALPALRRAGQVARLLAEKTGTRFVASESLLFDLSEQVAAEHSKLLAKFN